MSNHLHIECMHIFQMDELVGVDLFEDFDLNRAGSKYRMSFMHYNKKSETLDTHTFYFMRRNDFKSAEIKLKDINLEFREGRKRKLCVFVNPISGKGLSREYYRNILLPMLTFARLEHDMFETDSEIFIEQFLEKLDAENMTYTEFVVVGGDGVFNQLLNSIMKHPNKEILLKCPIGFIPGGSSNALCCDLGGKDPFVAGLNLVRGNTLKGDIFRIAMSDSGK